MYFEKDIQTGVPTLTEAGREALEAEIKYEFDEQEQDQHSVGRVNDGTAA